MWLNVRIYVGLNPQEGLDLSRLRERVFKLLGPAIPDASGWGLLRPGIISPYLLNRIPRELRIGELAKDSHREHIPNIKLCSTNLK